MNHTEIASLMAHVAPVIRDYTSSSVTPLLARIDSLEKQLAEVLPSRVSEEVAKAMTGIVLPKDGAPGKDGTDGAPGRDGVDGTLGPTGPCGDKGEPGEAVIGPPGERGIDGVNGTDGAPGLDGKDADPDLILKMVTEAVDAIPVPRDGRDGKDADPEAIASLVAETVAKAVSALPVAKDGIDGKNGAEGIPGRDGRDGLAGLQGEKGIDGLNGKDGRDGIDGLGFDDFSVEHDGERTVTLKWAKGDRVEERAIVFPVTIYRGIYKSGTQYQRGDSVTFSGSTHIAENDTTEKPETGKDWRLAVKRGRDGQDGIVKEAPKPKVVKV